MHKPLTQDVPKKVVLVIIANKLWTVEEQAVYLRWLNGNDLQNSWRKFHAHSSFQMGVAATLTLYWTPCINTIYIIGLKSFEVDSFSIYLYRWFSNKQASIWIMKA
jgi:hypothetical protein